MHNMLKPWYHYPGFKKRYYDERRMLNERGFVQLSEEDTNGILSFMGDVCYKDFCVTCIIRFRATHPLHAPFTSIVKINGQSFPDYFPMEWRHLALDGTLCLYNDKRDKWSTNYTASDIIDRVHTWLKSNVNQDWNGKEVEGPDPSFPNPAKRIKAVYISEPLLSIPNDVFGTFTFYYKKEEKKAFAYIKDLKYSHENGGKEKTVQDNTIIPYLLPINSKDVRMGYFFTIDGPLPYRTENKILEWMLEHPSLLEIGREQQNFWFKNAIKKKKALPGYPPLAIAVRYKDERTRAYLKEDCWAIFIMEGGNLSKQKGEYVNYPPVYISEGERMVRSIHVHLKDKKIAVVGCGTIGGEIALQLGKNGVGNMYLYDYDHLSIGNAYRHVLNWTDVQNYKVNALKLQILRFNPYCHIESRVWSVDGSLVNMNTFLNQVQGIDLVIVAVGDRDSYYYISWMLKKHNIPHVLVWSNWGAWGAEMVFISPEDGCLNCYDMLKQDQIIPTLSESPDQIDVYDGGCGFPTTPGNSFDLGIISHYATKKIVEYLHGQTQGYHHMQMNNSDDNIPCFSTGPLPSHRKCKCSRNQ